MDNTTIFIQQAPNFQFLSVCHYITILGVYFYNNDLIKLEERNQSVPVLNTLFDYINKSENQSQTKYQILKKVLKGSDLYGGGENETLDMKYVDETYHYIISTVLFSHYGNINGYLAKIINRANDVNYSAFKEMVLRHLSERYITKEYCSSGNFSSRLSPLAIDKVYQEHILPIFPEPEEDISILDVSYIYAMVGLKIVKSITEVTNFTFREYILIAREIDLQDLNDETDQMVLKLFSTPALFCYAFKHKEKFRNTDKFTLSVEFWKEAYEKLFMYINSNMREIVKENLEDSLYNKLEEKVSNLKNRTYTAEIILQKYCDYQNTTKIPELHISIYKTFYKWLAKILLPIHCRTDLPDLEALYYDQFTEVEKTYNEIERNSIEKVLEDSKLLDIMDVNSIVKLGQLPLPSTMGCNLCSPTPLTMNKNIYFLFTIIRKDKDSIYYALRQENHVLSLLRSSKNERNFAIAVANDSSLRMNTGLIPTTLKFEHEDHKIFVQRVADIKTKEFISGLKMYYYDETLGEKYLNFFKSLIPFYNCIESATTDRGGEAVYSCSVDVLSLIPFAGLAAKYTTKIGSGLSANIGNMFLTTNALAKTGIITKLPIMRSLNKIAKIAAGTIAKEILNRNLLKDLTVITLRTLDPGFELFYKVSNYGIKRICQMLQNIVTSFKNFVKLENIQKLLKLLLITVKKEVNLVTDLTGLVSKVVAERDGYNIVRYIYPGGSHFFGPSCVSSLGRSAELRTIEGSSTKIPVLAITNPDKTFYKQYIPETGEILNSKLKMDGNDVLHRIGYLIDKMVLEGHNINILRNYQVYHNAMDWKKTPTKEAPEQNLNQPTERDNSLQHLETIVDQIDNKENVLYQNFQQHSTEKRLFPESVKPEFSETSKLKKTNDDMPQSVVQGAEEGNIPIKIRRIERPGELEITFQYVHKKFDVEVPGKAGRVHILSEGPSTLNQQQKQVVQEKNKKVDKKSEKPETSLQNKNKMKKLDDLAGISRQAVELSPKFYKNVIRNPSYAIYSQILIAWKEKGLSSIRQNNANMIFLRKSVNELALLQLHTPVQIPNKLWFSQMVFGQRKIDALKNLEYFFFNDITLLTSNPFELPSKNKIGELPVRIEVVYHLTVDSPYGFVDLDHFHEKLGNNYVTFNDIFFKVTNTYFNDDKRVLNIHLKTGNVSKDYWKCLRQLDNENLEKEKSMLDSPRMKRITEAANIFVEDGILSTFKVSSDFLLNYILNTKQSISSIVPSYSMLANDVIEGKSLNYYNNWKIQSNTYIKDVLQKQKLDDVIDLSTARSRIHEVYDSVYFQNIEEAFRNYRRISGAEKRFRFEDYYVLHSYVKHRLLTNVDGMRRLEVAINRLALRQCDEEWITNTIVLYRAEFITREMSRRFFKSFFKEHIIAFNQMKEFSKSGAVEVVNCLNKASSTSEIPLVMEVTLTNQAGVVDIGRAFNDEISLFVATSDFPFVLDEIYYKKISNQDVLVMKMHDNPNPTERRMVRMANRLHELFSEDTKFYSTAVKTLE